MKKSKPQAVPFYLVVLFLLSAGLFLVRCVTLRVDDESKPGPKVESPKVEFKKIINEKSKVWALWNGGTKLRGANVWQKRIEPAVDGDGFGNAKVGPPYSDEDLASLSALGANWINLSYPGLFTEQPPYVLDEAVEKELDRWLERCAKHKLYVTLSFRTGPGRNEAIFDANAKSRANHKVWTDKAAQEGWVEMWKHTANRYGHHPVVAGFHLMVEPNGNSVVSPPIEEADAFFAKYKGKTVDWNPLAIRLIKVIRSQNSEVPILAGAMNYSSLGWASSLDLPDTHNVITNVHFYEPYQYSHKEVAMAFPAAQASDSTDGEVWDATWLKTKLAQVKQIKKDNETPVSIGEFGVFRHQTGATRYLEAVTSQFEELGVNYSVWLWESSFKKIDYDQFNYRRGTDEKNHQDIKNNVLLEVLKKRWAKNAVRPS